MPENWADTTRTVSFRKAVEFQLNEQPGKLKIFASQAGYSGKKVQIEDRFDDLVAREITNRNSDTVNDDTNVNRRWIVKPPRAGVVPLLDPDDQMSTEVDIKSPLATGVARAIRRYQDDKWLQGYYGTAYTGEEGVTGVPFKSANIMAVDYSTTGTPSGLTLNKLIGMKKLMMQRFVDTEMEMPIIVVTASQVEDLLKIQQVQSRDYNPQAIQALQNGKVTEFMGFRFVPAEIGNAAAYPLSSTLTIDGSGYRRVPVFVPSGMHFGTWLDFQGHVDVRADKHHSTQIAGYTCGQGTRVLEDKCFQILCAE